ncbi:cupin [Prauserella marina]|uniref:Cupin domain protein n=1 Tax=Prauserella marina TaxID=530584 RepID=A0A222VSK0_9PSEU|nr:cupin domain-containing protein [Prauserella marina]ASR36906.1 cupin [Prauserella marina]PWV80152.1 quercetin dioxygenase-like cupin family protein [Prauserella marina]SDD48308.1 Cupin domain protein [Prauserella marina]
MIHIPPRQQAGTAGKAGSQFTGVAFPYVTMAATDGVVINTVDFTPGARTHWHSHEDGQILQVLAGRGLVQSEGGPVVILRAGDTVWVPPGERHWHGAAPDSFMVHTAISLGETTWDAPVAEEEYRAKAEENER